MQRTVRPAALPLLSLLLLGLTLPEELKFKLYGLAALYCVDDQ